MEPETCYDNEVLIEEIRRSSRDSTISFNEQDGFEELGFQNDNTPSSKKLNHSNNCYGQLPAAPPTSILIPSPPNNGVRRNVATKNKKETINPKMPSLCDLMKIGISGFEERKLGRDSGMDFRESIKSFRESIYSCGYISSDTD